MSVSDHIYGDSVSLIRKLSMYSGAVERYRSEVDEIGRRIVDAIGREEAELLALTQKTTPGNHLYSHSTNVAILAAYISGCLGATKEAQGEIASYGLVHDILRGELLLRKGGTWSVSKIEQQLHKVGEATNLFRHVLDIEKTIPDSLGHIYDPGQDPDLEKAEAQQRRTPHQGAHIVGLCDLFESMTHFRDWRSPLLPHEALLLLLRQHRRHTDRALVAAFVERVTLYPPGTYVKISDGSICRVLSIDSESPSRPVVEAWIGLNGSPQYPRSIMDLREQNHLYIDGAIDEVKLPVENLRMRLKLQMGRWWVPSPL